MGKMVTALSKSKSLSGDDVMVSVPDEPNVNGLDSVRVAGYAAFGKLDWEVAVLDLEYDSIIDSPAGHIGDVRHLRFVGQECVVEVDLHGCERVTVDVCVSPRTSVVVELCTQHERGQSRILWSSGLTLTRIGPKLSSFYLRWPKSTRQPVRTAWVLL
jgi:hypothetical protein